ncbi:MAG: diacylglycerol kinase [Gammaproteobacteria bacterium]|nr:diacylglycerol kinase [Gammaproteobacteria bacterium]
MKNEATGVQRIFKAAGFSWQGLRSAYANEAAFRQEVWLAVVLLPLSFWVAGNGVEWALLISTVLLLLIVELLNSAVEAVVDRFGDEWHELSGLAKDVGSAAVLLALLMLGSVWIAIIFF